MLVFNKLNNLNYIRAKQSALIIARRTATPAEQRAINNDLDIIYNAKRKLFESNLNISSLKILRNGTDITPQINKFLYK